MSDIERFSVSSERTPLPRVDELIAFLQANRLVHGLAPAEIAELIYIAQVVRVQPHETIVRRGETGDAWYLLYEGRLSVYLEDNKLAELKPGECFGELSILDGEPRSASVVSEEAGILIRIPQEGFAQLLEANSLAAYKMVLALTRVVTRRLRTLVAGDLPVQVEFSSGDGE